MELKPRGPFKFKGQEEDSFSENKNVFEAKFPLPDDGTPGSSRELSIIIKTDPEGGNSYLSVGVKGRRTVWAVNEAFIVKDAAVELLYGAITTELMKIIKPI